MKTFIPIQKVTSSDVFDMIDSNQKIKKKRKRPLSPESFLFIFTVDFKLTFHLLDINVYICDVLQDEPDRYLDSNLKELGLKPYIRLEAISMLKTEMRHDKPLNWENPFCISALQEKELTYQIPFPVIITKLRCKIYQILSWTHLVTLGMLHICS
ncbi:hypothetical protein CEXT_29311 [Caerostris extrusa]|uniref:Uncharacterized protein n=1 Tax=Caerostris extrusa TaxID=172846 RepID=A0AAV4Y6G9_CAEEX|nr:hypothetical protein CEXT_29311 [Caerostris extrusa]